MASRKIFYAKPNYIYPTPQSDTDNNHFEFDEADLWNNSNEVSSSIETKKPIPTSRSSKKYGKKIDIGDRGPVTSSSSLPMNIPDWSKILKEDYSEHQRRDSDHEGFVVDNDDGDDQDGRVPPHEYLARTREASFSVHEGAGRTLKGRDLRRVRNAIWKKVGFED